MRPAGRLALFALAVVAWLVGFEILARTGSWAPFALAGPVLAAIAIGTDPVLRPLLRPSARGIALGLAVGLLMTVATHAAFALLAPRLPGATSETLRLFELLRVHGFSPEARALLIVLVAASEEVVFRGTLLAHDRPPDAGPGRADLLRILALALAYAVAMITLRSPLLVLCAFVCGVIWGALRVGARSLVPAIVAHVVWDLGVLVVWPLVPDA